MKHLLLCAAIVGLGLIGCGGDPAPTEGDAEITKGMPQTQEPPPSAAAREKAQPQAPTALDITK